MAANFPLGKGQTVFLPLMCTERQGHSLKVSQAFKNHSQICSCHDATGLEFDSAFTSPFVCPKLYTPT